MVTPGKNPASLPGRVAAWRRESRQAASARPVSAQSPLCPTQALLSTGEPSLPGHLLCGQGLSRAATLVPYRKQAARCGDSVSSAGRAPVSVEAEGRVSAAPHPVRRPARPRPGAATVVMRAGAPGLLQPGGRAGMGGLPASLLAAPPLPVLAGISSGPVCGSTAVGRPGWGPACVSQQRGAERRGRAPRASQPRPIYTLPAQRLPAGQSAQGRVRKGRGWPQACIHPESDRFCAA